MGEEVKWHLPLAIGLIFTSQTFLDWGAPEGPWDSSTFSSGVLGLVGLGALYTAKYRIQFQRNGLIPYLNFYRCERGKIPLYILAEGLIILGLMIALNNLNGGFLNVPKPAPLILLLYACLFGLHSLYAWMVIHGPLKESE